MDSGDLGIRILSALKRANHDWVDQSSEQCRADSAEKYEILLDDIAVYISIDRYAKHATSSQPYATNRARVIATSLVASDVGHYQCGYVRLFDEQKVLSAPYVQRKRAWWPNSSPARV